MFLPKATERTIYQPWMSSRQCLIIQPQLFHHTRSKVLDNNIGNCNQLSCYINILSIFQIQRNTPFPTIDTDKVCAHITYKWRTERACIIPILWVFNLDNICTLDLPIASFHKAQIALDQNQPLVFPLKATLLSPDLSIQCYTIR